MKNWFLLGVFLFLSKDSIAQTMPVTVGVDTVRAVKKSATAGEDTGRVRSASEDTGKAARVRSASEDTGKAARVRSVSEDTGRAVKVRSAGEDTGKAVTSGVPTGKAATPGVLTGGTKPAAGDTVIVAQQDSTRPKSKKFIPVPKTATRLALIPGGGQIYNRDYWKLPIVYLAFGGGLYAYYLNSIKYKDYLDTYKSFYDLDVNSKNYGNIKKGLTPDSTKIVRVRNLLNTESEYLPATRDQAARGKNYWRRNRGFSLIVSGLIYSLSIIEANVAAHLKTFDLSEDLSMRIEPKLNQPAMRTPTPGVRLVFNIK